MPLSRNEFARQLTDSGLLDSASVAEALSSLPPDKQPQDGEQLARELVKQKKLTKFQAEQLYAGRGKSLTLGNYVILDKLGQGGMGMVLKAWHRRMERTVALKVIAPKVVQDAVALKRFQREVVAAAKLTHPNIVAAYDADEAKGTHFLVMEYVEGSDLSSWVKQHGPMSVERAVNCVAQAARGLAYAHEKGVVHRDIKPHNLLMDQQGTVKILDMGLARIEAGVGGSAETADLTNSGAMMGTVDYMAPEQAMDSKHADARSDIYSLGCTLFFLLTGRATFAEDTVMKRLTAHQNAPPPSLVEEAPQAFFTWHGGTSTERGGSSEQLTALNAVFQRMVAKKPADRFQSMSEVITTLEQCRSGFGFTDGGATTADSAMRSFFQGITGEGSTATRTAATGSQRTAVLPGADDATIVESQFAIDTDSKLHETIAREAQPAKAAPKKFPHRVLLAAVIAGVLLVAGLFALRGKSGTLHLEVADELTEVTVGETGHVVKGKSEQDLRLPLGEHVLHIKRNDLAFDTDAFQVTKEEIVSIKVERVGRRVRAMMGNTLLGHKEEPRGKSEAIANTSGSPPQPAKAPFDAKQARMHQQAWANHLGVSVEYTNSIGMKFVLIPPGEFLMGSTPKEIELKRQGMRSDTLDFLASEAPQHRIILTRPIYVGVHEVTQAQFQQVMGSNPSTFAATGPDKERAGKFVGVDTANHPVDSVNWLAAADFCKSLSQREGRRPYDLHSGSTVTNLTDGDGYRLPTEAEWEFACRAGTTTLFWWGDGGEFATRAAWHGENSNRRTHPVGELSANPFGLYDVCGNVLEWVQDWWAPSYYTEIGGTPARDPLGGRADEHRHRVLRGGAWWGYRNYGSSAHRHVSTQQTAADGFGFRVVLSIEAVKDSLAAQARQTSGRHGWPVDAPRPAIAPFDAKQARAHQEAWAKHLGMPVETTNSVGAKMIVIPPGEFLMGSTDQQVQAALKVAEELKVDQFTMDRIQKAERPQHQVVITKPFLMGATEVTVGQFRKFVEATKFVTEAERSRQDEPSDKKADATPKPPNWREPGYPITDGSPVAAVSWNDAVAFCQWLSEQEKATYRLPTEAEWEYACRAGTTTQYSFGDDHRELAKFGWYGKDLDYKSQSAGTKLPNAFGLHDMHGNLWEWCGDYWDEKWYERTSPNDPTGPSSGDDRVARGGYWYGDAPLHRSAYRNYAKPSSRHHGTGFRYVRVLDAAAATVK